MSEIIETEQEDKEQNLLEGEHSPPPHQVRHFACMSKALDFVYVFKIEDCNIRSGVHPETGKHIVQVEYWRK